MNRVVKTTVWCRAEPLIDGRAERGEKEKELKEKRMWPAVKDDWRGVEFSV